MNATDKSRFKRLMKRCTSLDGDVRVLARLELKKFVEVHGKAECQKVYDNMRKAKRS
jgi:hypothetical protein